LIGVPYDGGVTNRPGARFGPREVRNQSVSNVRRVNQATGASPFDEPNVTIADCGDVFAHRPFELESAHKDIEDGYNDLREAGVDVILAVGGDHSISLPILRSIEHHNGGKVALVHIDAHADTGDDYGGSRFHHGAPFKIAVDEGLIDPKKTIQIGIRGSVNHKDMWSFSYESGMRVVPMEVWCVFVCVIVARVVQLR
jgi:guanidinopropionase